MKFIDYQPGNGTRYPVYLGQTDKGNWIITLMWSSGSGGTAFKFSGAPIHYSYIIEKLKLNFVADAAALLALIHKETGIEVYMPDGFNEKGLYRDVAKA